MPLGDLLGREQGATRQLLGTRQDDHVTAHQVNVRLPIVDDTLLVAGADQVRVVVATAFFGDMHPIACTDTTHQLLRHRYLDGVVDLLQQIRRLQEILRRAERRGRHERAQASFVLGEFLGRECEDELALATEEALLHIRQGAVADEVLDQIGRGELLLRERVHDELPAAERFACAGHAALHVDDERRGREALVLVDVVLRAGQGGGVHGCVS